MSTLVAVVSGLLVAWARPRLERRGGNTSQDSAAAFWVRVRLFGWLSVWPLVAALVEGRFNWWTLATFVVAASSFYVGIKAEWLYGIRMAKREERAQVSAEARAKRRRAGTPKG